MIKDRMFNFWDWIGRSFFEGRARLNYKFKVEYRRGVQQGKIREHERTVYLLEHYGADPDLLQLIKWHKPTSKP